MNQTLKLLVPVALFLFASCGEITEDQPAGETTNTGNMDELAGIDFSDMTMYDFTKDKVDLPFRMMLPLKTAGQKPEIGHQEDVTWNIMLDDEKFSLVIEDWGDEVQTIEGVKERLTSNIFDLVPETEDDDEIIYKYRLKNTEGEEKPMTIAHFCLIRHINGTYYTIHSNDFGTFSLSRVKDMMRSAKSFQPAEEEV